MNRDRLRLLTHAQLVELAEEQGKHIEKQDRYIRVLEDRLLVGAGLDGQG